MVNPSSPPGYRGRHARTFWIAQERARAAGGELLLRSEDLDAVRFRLDYEAAMIADLAWVGLRWSEGPDVGGPHAPYRQSQRRSLYRAALGRLHAAGQIFPCTRSRRDVLEAAAAPHEGGADDEPVYPAEFRPPAGTTLPPLGEAIAVNWRFRVPAGERLAFTDSAAGPQAAVAGRDFGDFLVWRKDDVPSYQLACVVDDAAMGVTEVVRGADLIRSTFRQLLLYRALGWAAPGFHHCPLLLDEHGVRLAKRHDALSLRALREQGMTPEHVREKFQRP
jgi:glutamyl-tRNA synthetase